jgi:Pup amidohydrolase
VLERLLGLETEYAIRWSPDADGERPAHDLVHTALKTAIAQRFATRSGARESTHQQVFLENGGALYYEFLPHAPSGGVIEASTPECRGPSTLLLYQKAQEQLLIDALPEAQAWLATQGYVGELGLLQNCRDAQGHVYGAQENYEVELARGLGLVGYRVALALLLPLIVSSGLLVLLVSLACLAVFVLVLIALLLAAIVGVFVAPGRTEVFDRALDQDSALMRGVMRTLSAIGSVGAAPGVLAYALVFRGFCCRRVRRDSLGFLLSRPILSGAGTLDPQSGEFALSEKGPAIRRLVRMTSLPVDRSVFDIGHLVKALFSISSLELRPLAKLFHRRQRLQLGLSDSNLAQTAAYLKVATTALVFDMAEAGALQDLPRVRRPIAALHRLIGDPELRVSVRCSDGVSRSALELQRLYLERAREFVARSPTPSLEAAEIVRLWAEVLDTLATEPAALFGRLDWVTKRSLLATAGAGLELSEQKKIDLKYHELGVGYFAQLEREGLAPTLVEPEEVERAQRVAPHDSPARRRSLLIRTLAAEGVRALVSWDRVEIHREGERRRVIRLDDYR